MARPEVTASGNFFHFVTAHGPFELTAIVLSAGAGLHIGMGWLDGSDRKLMPEENSDRSDDVGTFLAGLYKHGLRFAVFQRVSSLFLAARTAMPIMGAAMIMFLLAAFIEGFLSPSALPYWTKAAVAIGSSMLLTFYFIVLGFPRRRT